MRLLAFLLLFLAAPLPAQNFPALTGRVVDEAGLLPPGQAAELEARSAALEQATARQFVIATIRDLQGYPIEDYGYRLGRHWGIGHGEADNGIILIVAPAERRVRIEVGHGLEPIMTDALSSQIINRQILPPFRADDPAGGIQAGADAILEQLQAPPEAAEQRVLEAAEAERRGGGGSLFPLVFWLVVLGFVIVPMLRSGFDGGGRSYGRRRRRRGMPIVIWGPGMGGGSRRSGGWGGGLGGGGFGGGGFRGGGGGFGGGGASGGW